MKNKNKQKRQQRQQLQDQLCSKFCDKAEAFQCHHQGCMDRWADRNRLTSNRMDRVRYNHGRVDRRRRESFGGQNKLLKPLYQFQAETNGDGQAKTKMAQMRQLTTVQLSNKTPSNCGDEGNGWRARDVPLIVLLLPGI